MDEKIQFINKKYEMLCKTKSDINEHLPVLFKYASKCDSAIECGVRRCVSCWSLLHGLLSSERSNEKKMILNDILPCDVTEIIANAPSTGIKIEYAWCPDVDLKIDGEYDLVFIDTWHVYGLLKRELNKFGKIIKKYIIMHDTTIDEIHSESVRNKHDIEKKMREFNYTYDEVTIGLGQAIDEFLTENPEWKLIEKLTNNNGLTVLERV
jgi:hypothetical protein